MKTNVLLTIEEFLSHTMYAKEYLDNLNVGSPRKQSTDVVLLTDKGRGSGGEAPDKP